MIFPAAYTKKSYGSKSAVAFVYLLSNDKFDLMQAYPSNREVPFQTSRRTNDLHRLGC